MAQFKESEHPRDKDGKFADKGKKFTTIKLKPKTKEKLKRYFEKIKSNRYKKTKDVHPNKWKEPPALNEQMAKYLDTDKFTANQIVQSIIRWSDGVYANIRKAQQENNVTSPFYKIAKYLEEYIDKSPKWKGKPIYRGVHLTQEQIDEYNVGDVKDMMGLSSWTSEKIVANMFAENNKKQGEQEVIFISNNGTNQGSSITQLAKYPEEAEILISSQAMFKVTKKYIVGKKTYIELEEL